MKNQIIWIIFVFISLLSCSKKQTKNPSNTLVPYTIEANEYVIPIDSIALPKSVTTGKPKVVLAPIPKVVFTNTNVHSVGKPKVFLVKNPQIITLGKDTFLLPKSLKAINNSISAGIPEIVIAKDPSIKEQNPQNFSTFSKLQGLKNNLIRCMLKDQNGNIWFGALGQGATKYDGKSFTHYTQKEGLCDNRVYCIFQDESGNIWFGTLGGGVSKFDGKSFTNFSTKEGLCNDRVFSITQDKGGNLWFGTDGGGVSKYDGKSFTKFTEKEGLINNYVLSILVDQIGNLWFGTDAGVCKFDGEAFTYFAENAGLKFSVYSIYQDDRRNIWFGSDGGGVSKLTINEVKGLPQYTFTNYTEKEGLCMNRIFCISQDNIGNLWFGSYGGGISKYDENSFTNYSEQDGLNSNKIVCILEDQNKNLWFGTFGGGVSKYYGNIFSHYTLEEGLNNNTVSSIIQEKSGNLWFGTMGGGVTKFDGKKFNHYTQKEGQSNNRVISILQDKSANFWFGTDGGGVYKYDGKNYSRYTEKEGLCNNVVRCIIQSEDGDIWFGTNVGVSKYDGKKFTNFTKKEGLSNNFVLTALQDRNGNIWFGTDGGGVSKYNGVNFTHFTKKEGLSDNSVLSILQDKSGNIWFGTENGGVSRYDGKYFTHFTEKEGLCSNSVYSILQDKRGIIWFGTRLGLSKLLSKNLARYLPDYSKGIIDNSSINNSQEPILFKNYTYDDGFLGIGCNRSAIYEDKNGAIWIGSNDRLTAYHPEGDTEDTIPPNIQLTNIDLYNENIPWLNLQQNKDLNIILGNGNGVAVKKFYFDSISKWYGLPHNLSLIYNNNYLTFKFIGITHEQSKKVKYQYKLEGLDEYWSAPTLRNEVSYSNLPHGSYTFKVTAMNSEGYWSNEYEYSFSIRPPWWKTWWFKALLVVLIITSVFISFRWRVAMLRKQKNQLVILVKEKTAKVVQQQDELQAFNEELIVTNEELCNQREELESTLHSLKETQRQLVQSEKMASIGVLAAGIAHEINNPLNFIHGGIRGIENYFEGNPSNDKSNVEFFITAINEGVKRSADIVSGLNLFSRSGDFISDKVDIHTIIDNCLLMLQNKTKNRIEIIKKYTNQQYTLIGNEGKLHQAILNILANAIQANDDKGTITVITEIEGERMKISVIDTGCGINEENLPKILDPFFTTKETGTGLGLSITYTILKEHDGTIEVESKLGKGTTVIISLPVK